MQKILICDIDNTVADQMSRLHRYHDRESGKVDIEKAYSAEEILRDQLLDHALEGVQHFSDKGYKIVWLTARKENLAEATEQWLKASGFPVDELILVDRLSDKIAIIREMQPALVIDDCQYNLAALKPLPATDFIREVEEMGVCLEVFKDNWREIREKYRD